MQHVGEAARRDLQPEVGSQQVSDLRQRHSHLRVQLDDQRDHAGTKLHARRAEGVGRLQLMAALHPTPTPQAVPDLDVEATHDGAHHGQVFLILRRHPGHFHRAAAVRARRGNRRRVGLVDPFRGRATALTAVLRAGPPAGLPAATLRPALGKRRGLAAPRAAALGQLLLQVLDLLLQALVLPLQPVVLPLQALAVALTPRQLALEPFDFGVLLLNLMRRPLSFCGRHANSYARSPQIVQLSTS